MQARLFMSLLSVPRRKKLWQALTTPEFSRQYWFGVSTVSSWETGAPWALKFDDGRVPDSGIVTESDPRGGWN